MYNFFIFMQQLYYHETGINKTHQIWIKFILVLWAPMEIFDKVDWEWSIVVEFHIHSNASTMMSRFF